MRALRDFDRSRRAERTRKSGHPERRAELVSAFRLVRFRPGSGVVTLEPDLPQDLDEEVLFEGDVELPIHNLSLLADHLDRGDGITLDVIDALDKACSALGEDGKLSIELPDRNGHRSVVVDRPRLEQIASSAPTKKEEEVRSISGRLHLVDLEPDRLAIRTSAGIEWVCRYPDSLEEKVRGLIGEIVWATGLGKLVSPLRGTMEIERIEAVLQGEQSQLFSPEPVSIEKLLERHEVVQPQGLDSLGDPEWEDEADEAYLAALFDDE